MDHNRENSRAVFTNNPTGEVLIELWQANPPPRQPLGQVGTRPLRPAPPPPSTVTKRCVFALIAAVVFIAAWIIGFTGYWIFVTNRPAPMGHTHGNGTIDWGSTTTACNCTPGIWSEDKPAAVELAISNAAQPIDVSTDLQAGPEVTSPTLRTIVWITIPPGMELSDGEEYPNPGDD